MDVVQNTQRKINKQINKPKIPKEKKLPTKV